MTHIHHVLHSPVAGVKNRVAHRTQSRYTAIIKPLNFLHFCLYIFAWSQYWLKSTPVVPWIVTVSVLHGVRDVLFPRSRFLTRNKFLSLVKWLHDTLRSRSVASAHVQTTREQLQQQRFYICRLTPTKFPQESKKKTVKNMKKHKKVSKNHYKRFFLQKKNRQNFRNKIFCFEIFFTKKSLRKRILKKKSKNVFQKKIRKLKQS